MSVMFSSLQLAGLEVKNRFICSATSEGMASRDGMVSDGLLKRYRNLARGGAGMIVTGHMYVHPAGRASLYQTGIDKDDLLPGLEALVRSVHHAGGKVLFQLSHAGRQTTRAIAGRAPLGAYAEGRDPVNFVKPIPMNENQIEEVILAFRVAASRAVKAGADGIQVHASHGYLVNQFLSPFFNRRSDQWGGSAENRFRLLERIIIGIRRELGPDRPLLVKLNTDERTPRPGINPELAKQYVRWLAQLNIDGVELSSGTASYSFMQVCRGQIPADELLSSAPWWMRIPGRLMLKKMAGKFDLEEGYNLPAAIVVKQAAGDMPLFVVGGMRRLAHMEAIVEKGHAAAIAMSRPFIREPFIINRFKSGKANQVACISCNKCLAALVNRMPVRCYDTSVKPSK